MVSLTPGSGWPPGTSYSRGASAHSPLLFNKTIWLSEVNSTHPTPLKQENKSTESTQQSLSETFLQTGKPAPPPSADSLASVTKGLINRKTTITH